MEDRIRYVYKIFDKLNEDKFYIGTTFNIDRRWKEHKRESNSKKLKEDMLEYGTQDFDIETIFEGIEDEVYEKEIQLIKELKPYYNNKNDKGGKIGTDEQVLFGENHPNHKLTDEDIIDICIRVVLNNEKISKVHCDYKQIDISAIYNIVNGKLWKHVKNAPRKKAQKRLTIIEAQDIRELAFTGLSSTQIHKDFYPNTSPRGLRSIINGTNLKNVEGPIKGKDY